MHEYFENMSVFCGLFVSRNPIILTVYLLSSPPADVLYPYELYALLYCGYAGLYAYSVPGTTDDPPVAEKIYSREEKKLLCFEIAFDANISMLSKSKDFY